MPLGLQEFLNNRHTNLARFSALYTSCLYQAGVTPVTHFFYQLIRPQSHTVAGKIKLIQNLIKTPTGIKPPGTQRSASTNCATADSSDLNKTKT